VSVNLPGCRHCVESQLSTYVGHDVLKPSILPNQLFEPLAGGGTCILLAAVDDGVLVVDAGLGYLATYPVELGPGSFLEALQVGAWGTDGEVVCTGPGRSVLDVVVAGHVLADYGDGEAGVLGQHQGGGKADDACAVDDLPVLARGNGAQVNGGLPNNHNARRGHGHGTAGSKSGGDDAPRQMIFVGGCVVWRGHPRGGAVIGLRPRGEQPGHESYSPELLPSIHPPYPSRPSVVYLRRSLSRAPQLTSSALAPACALALLWLCSCFALVLLLFLDAGRSLSPCLSSVRPSLGPDPRAPVLRRLLQQAHTSRPWSVTSFQNFIIRLSGAHKSSCTHAAQASKQQASKQASNAHVCLSSVTRAPTRVAASD